MGMDLGSYLALARKERGFTQRELAEKCGTCASEICRLEAGKRVKPSPALLHALSEALLVSYPYLMQLAGYSAGEAEELPEQEVETPAEEPEPEKAPEPARRRGKHEAPDPSDPFTDSWYQSVGLGKRDKNK